MEYFKNLGSYKRKKKEVIWLEFETFTRFSKVNKEEQKRLKRI